MTKAEKKRGEKDLRIMTAVIKGLDRASNNGFSKRFDVAISIRIELQRAGFVVCERSKL